MATFPLTPGDICEINVVSTMRGSTIMNVYHYQFSPSGSAAADGKPIIDNLGLLFEALLYGAGGVIPLEKSDNLIYDYMRLQIIYPTRRFYVVKNMGYPGSWNTGLDLPTDLQLCSTFRATTTGRGRAGRKADSGFQTDQLLNQTWNAALLNYWGTTVAPRYLATITTAVGIKQFVPVIWNSRHPGSPNEISSVYVNPQARVMRRRQLGLGI